MIRGSSAKLVKQKDDIHIEVLGDVIEDLVGQDMKLTDILKEAGIEMGKVYTDKDKPPFQVNEKKEDIIYVPGLAGYSYKGLKKNIEGKLKDLTKRNKKGDHTGVGKNQLSVLSAMWVALKEYEEEMND